MKNITVSYKNSFIEAVILANKELYTYINTNLSLNDYEYTNTIGFGGDNSLKIDLIAENIFIKHLEKFGNIYSEECGLKSSNKECTIIIDPLDGSNNFYSQLPYNGT
jgi:myo-inositol-1(or 4)-monophosphatase